MNKLLIFGFKQLAKERPYPGLFQIKRLVVKRFQLAPCYWGMVPENGLVQRSRISGQGVANHELIQSVQP